MTEQKRRALLSAVTDELDRRIAGLVGQTARKVLLSTTLGAGLALAGCSDDGGTTKQDSGVKPDSSITDGSTTDSAVTDSAVTDSTVPTDNGIEEDSAASDSTKPQEDMKLGDAALDDGSVVDYMAPDATLKDSAASSDLLPLDAAMPDASLPDSGIILDGAPVPPYMGPDGMTTLYMAPDPGEAKPLP